MFYGERLRQARELRRLTQSALGELVGRSQGTIANLEAGLLLPSQELLADIAKGTGFPASFFPRAVLVEFPSESLMFRARAATTRSDAAAARRFAEIVYEVVTRVLERYVDPIPISVEKTTASPIVAAQQTRRLMGLLPDQPITNVIHAIEKAGVVVLALPISLEKIDAFSAWIGPDNRPVIAICGGKPGDRLRWNVSHELGHLLLHSDRRQIRAQEHREADQFAAELLLPEVAMHEEIGSAVTLSSVAALKPKWGVAMQAIVRRASDLSLVTERQYRYLFEQFGMKGWRTREPANLDVPMEKPSALRQMAEIAYGTPVNYRRLASEAQLTVEIVKQIIEGYEESATPAPFHKSGKVIQMRR